MADEAKRLEELRRQRLREGLARVNKLEERATPEAIEKWIQSEYDRLGANRPDLED